MTLVHPLVMASNGLRRRLNYPTDKVTDPDSQLAATLNVTTTSTTLVALTGAVVTLGGTVTKNYIIVFTGYFSSTSATASIAIDLFINGVTAFAGLAQRSLRSIGANQNFMICTNWAQSLAPGTVLQIMWSTTAGTATSVITDITAFGVDG